MILLDCKKIIIIFILLITNNKINKKIIQSSENPKISIFLPTYNKEKYIEKALNSLQNQTLKDIEIIVINDSSNDNTSDIINCYASKDKRIKVLNNQKNYGLLYSRAMGIIHSSGEYLLNLDPDDELDDSDNLEYLYKKAVTFNVDIISFNYYLKSENKSINLCNDFDHVIRQPKIFESIFSDDFILRDYLIWNKIIKKDIFLKAYELFKNYIYYKKWNYHEDNIWSILVHYLASSKLCLNKTIYDYNNIQNNDSLMKTRKSLMECNNFIYRFEILRQILNSPIYFKYINAECNSLIENIYHSSEFRKKIDTNKNLNVKVFYNFKICFNNYNISNNYRNYTIDFIKSFNKSILTII